MFPLPQGTFGREPAAVKPDDDRYLRAAIQEYDNIAKLGQIIREGPIKVSAPSPAGSAPRPCLNLNSRMQGDGKLGFSGLKGIGGSRTNEPCGVLEAVRLAGGQALGWDTCVPLTVQGECVPRGRAGASLRGEFTLSFPQGSLLKVVLEDYLRLKKLFAQRMVQKASSCHSSISEVVR